jgi:hypothetical protein
MAFSGATNKAQDQDNGGWGEPEKVAVDWKKRALVVGLAVLSWVATYVGMLELIEANMGELPLVHKGIIGFSVAMLMTMVVWLLDEMFKPNPFITKAMYAFGYLFLTIISIGFGFGFYWKVLESRSEASRSAEGAVTQVQGSLVAASTRMDQLTATLDQLTAVSTQKAQTEKASGASCPNSKAGDGPRRKMREDDAARFSFAADFVKGRATAVKTEMAALDVDLAKIVTDDKSTIDAKSGNRNAFMQSLGRKLDNTVTGFNAFRTDPQLKQIRTDLAERGEKATFPDSQGKTYSCPDPQLQTALRGVVRAIDQLPELEKPKIAAVEGSEATIEAFRRLTASFYGLLSFKLPPSADELRDLQKKAIQSVETPTAASKHSMSEQPGLSKRDYVPLAIAVFVDLCLLLVSMGKSHDRMAGLLPKMRAAEQGPVIQILSRFNDIHRDRQIRENFELFRHVVFDFHGDYYVAVPLDAPRKMNPREREDLRLETQLLSNLFASFEKEKIFSRVYSPFLTASAVRKRLARQGSKFDRSDAFRLYRFKDGAWSDIILGAVMGAAKRVEAEKRVTTARAEETARANAVLAASTAQTTASAPIMTPASDDRWEPQWSPPKDPSPTADAQERFGAYAPYVTGVERPIYADNVRPLPQRGTTHEAQRGTSQDIQRGTSQDTQRGTSYDHHHSQRPTRFEPHAFQSEHGPTSTGMSAEYSLQADTDLEPANSNTYQHPTQIADVLPFTPPAAVRPGPQYNPRGSAAAAIATAYEPSTHAETATQVVTSVEQAATLRQVDAPPSTDWQRDIGIVMTRVTESITVPVTSEASLPRALMAALSKTAVTTQSTPVLPVHPVQRLTHSDDGEPSPEATPEDWDVTVTDFARRYVRRPAE